MNAIGSDMSEELKRKLFNYEVNPPDVMWAKIANTLEEEVNGDFTSKLYHAEVTPPTNVWNKIATTLDAEVAEKFPARLYDLEIAPPINAWQQISSALTENQSLPAIRPTRRIVPIVRYAAAACLVAVVTFGGIKLLNQKRAQQAISRKIVAPKSVTPQNTGQNTPQNSSAQSVSVASNNLPKEKTALAKVNVVSRKKPLVNQAAMASPPAEAIFAVNTSSSSNFNRASLIGDVPGNCPLIEDFDRYLNFMNPDGSLIRVSKKLADAVGCFYSKGNSTEYTQCQEQVKKWRDKISQSSAAPSADNFMDLLDIIKSVQDKEL